MPHSESAPQSSTPQTCNRQLANSRSSVKRRLLLGFGLLVFLLTLSGLVSYWQIARIDTALNRIVEVEQPVQQAVLEMEIHAGETARAILHHIHQPERQFAEQAHRSEAQFKQYFKRYFAHCECYAQGPQQAKLTRRVRDTFKQFKSIGDQLIAISTQRVSALAQLRSDVLAIDQQLEQFSHRAANQTHNTAQVAAALHMEVEIERTFAIVEAYVADHTPTMREELEGAIDRFSQLAQEYRQLTTSSVSQSQSQSPGKRESSTVFSAMDLLEKRFAHAVASAHQVLQQTDQLVALSHRFEKDLLLMDQVLDHQVQPLIAAQMRQAAAHAIQSSRNAILLLAGLSLLGVLFGGVLGWHISRGIVGPVRQLVRGSQLIGQGDRDHRIEVASRDEFGTLATAFNDMVDSLNHSTEELLQVQRQAEQLKLQAAEQQIQHHATAARTDQLTGLHNRRAFDDMMLHQIEESATTGASLTMILFDVDKFKVFNDTHGHQAGDLVLQGVAETLATVFTAPDFPTRFGGEEFAVLLPGSTLEEAGRKADEARLALEAATFEFEGKQLRVTTSGGVSQVQCLWESEEAVEANIELAVRQADDALYAAKDAGRNQVQLNSGKQITTTAQANSPIA